MTSTKTPAKTPAKKAAAKPKPSPKSRRPLNEMRVVYIGNFEPPHSTENHVARALEHHGIRVARCQESNPYIFDDVRAGLDDGRPDFILWTRTGWPWTDKIRTLGAQRLMQRSARRHGVPVVGYHLDIWWGLKREHLVAEEPFFESDLVITADGGHDERWAEVDVNHLWMPPGISLGEAEVGHTRTEFRSKLAFVGSHDGGYHAEHRHRHELVDWLRRNFRRDCLFFPMPGQPAVRGRDLQDLYASVDVVVGDSCFAGTGLENYWSDRIPETLGRGGFLLHPNVPGLEKHFKDGEHLCTWEAFDWEGLGTLIETALSSPEDRADITTTARYHVREHHTYERRVEQIVDALYERNLLR